MQIQALQGQRWFIWALVFLLVAGASLVTYIQYSSVTDAAAEPAPLVLHHASKAASKTPIAHH